jgi:hypothetical protein
MQDPSRRRFLGSVAAAGACALVGHVLHAQRGWSGPRRIDVHHHFQLAEIMAMERAGGAPPIVPWSLSRDLEDMDRFGTATAILSGFIPNSDDLETKRKAARILNEFAAKVRSDHPDRFGTDFWYRTAQDTGNGLVTSKVFNASELYALDRGNVERLIPRLRTAGVRS